MAYEYPPAIAETDFPDPRVAIVPAQRATDLAKITRRAHERRDFDTLDELRCSLSKLVVRSRTTGAALESSWRDGEAHAPIATDGAERFAFAPGVDRLELGWEVRGAPAITKLRFSLYRPGANLGSALLWEKLVEYRGKCPRVGHVYFDGDLAATAWRATDAEGTAVAVTVTNHAPALDFPDGVLNVVQGPYKLKLELVEHLGGTRLGATIRWLYLDVKLAGIELEWGDWKVRPKSRPDVIKQFTWTPRNTAVAQTLHVRTRVRAHERAILRALRQKAPTEDQDIVLPGDTHAFCTASTPQFTDDTTYRRHLQLWGNGPRLPLFAKLTVARSDGQAVDAPRALGGAELVWDWEEKPGDKLDDWLAPRIPASTRTYLQRALRYKVGSETAAGTQPKDATNCHADHGGKRGTGGAPVFPPLTPNAYTNATAAIIKHDFPFHVRAYPERRWAALSTARTAGVLAGYSGAIFQPSRMAGDTYKVGVYLKTRDFPHLRTGESIRSLVKAPFATSGVFTVKRSFRVHYFRLGNAKTVDADRLKALYAEGGVILEMGAPIPLNAAQYKNALDAVIAAPPTNASRFTPNFVPQHPQPVPTSAAMAVRTWGEYQTELQRLRSGNLQKLTTTGGHPFIGEKLTMLGKDMDVLSTNANDAYVIVNAGVPAVNDVLTRSTGAGTNTVNAVHVLSQQEKNDLVNLLAESSQTAYETQIPDNLAFQLSKQACRLYADTHHAADEGMFIFQFKTQFSGQRMVQPVRAVAPSDSCEPHRAVFIAFADYDRWRGENTRTIFPGTPRQSSLKAWKPLDPVMAHELGHNLAFNHASTVGNDAFHELTAGTANPIDNKDHCLMNYHPRAVRFCGKCLLRLRGWAALGPPQNAGVVALDSTAANNEVP